MKTLPILALASTLAVTLPVLAAPEPELPIIFSEDFEDGFSRWDPTDPNAWTHRKIDGNYVFGINKRRGDYKPEVRSPINIALVKDIEVSDFVLTFRVRSTKDTGDHRDCCVFFNHQDPTHFYYVHLGAKPDPASGQIMIVDGAPRKPLTDNKKNVPWTDGWHEVKVVRDSTAGSIEVFFDDMETPIMSANDKTFGKGRVGIGSFDDMNDFDDIVLRVR